MKRLSATTYRPLLEVIRSHKGGILMSEAQELLSISKDMLKKISLFLRAEGAAEFIYIGGPRPYWFTPENRQSVMARKAAVDAETANRRRTTRRARRRLERARYAEHRKTRQTRTDTAVSLVGDGSTAKQIADKMGCSKENAALLLRSAKKAGRVRSEIVGRQTIWLRHDAPKYEPPEPEEEDAGAVPFIHRQAPANAPLPFVCRAPRSVFDLGGMAA